MRTRIQETDLSALGSDHSESRFHQITSEALTCNDTSSRDESGRTSVVRKKWAAGGTITCTRLSVKVPVGTSVCFVVALGICGWRLVSRRLQGLGDDLVQLVPPIVLLALVSSQTGFSRYLRYILPIFPFLFVWVSQVAQFAVPILADRRDRRLPREVGNVGISRHGSWHWLRFGTAILILLGFFWSVASSIMVFPHSVSYFNELAGGAQNGSAHLLDGNIDWGQDLLYLKLWYDAHPDARPFYLSYFGVADPRITGFQTLPLRVPSDPTQEGQSNSSDGPLPGWHAISVNEIYSYKHSDYAMQEYKYLYKRQPAARVGYSILIYCITLDEANQSRRDLGRREVENDDGQ